MEDGKVYVSVDESLYKFEDVTTVLDADYWDAYNLAYAWSNDLSKIGGLNKVSLASKADVMELKEAYDNMTTYQKTFIAKDSVALLDAYIAKIDELQAIADNEKANEDAGETTGENADKGDTSEV